MSKHHEVPATEPANPIQAAIDKYGPGVPVPGLTAASPDEVLIVHLHRGDPVTPILAAIEPVYMRGRLEFGAPVAILDAKQCEFRDRNRKLMQAVPPNGFQSASRTTAEWHRDVAVLRSCLEHREWLTAFLARWANMNGTEQAAEIRDIENVERSRAFQASVAAVPQVIPDWREFVAALSREGIIITPTATGDLTVTNGNRLTPDARARLTMNKAAILATLGAVETI